MTEALLGSIAETALKDHCQKWRKIAFSTAATDREKAKEAVYQIYSQSNTRPPSLFLWLDSPLQGALAVALIQRVLKDGSYSSIVTESYAPSIAAYYQSIEERLQKQLRQRNDASFWSDARTHLQELVLSTYGQIAAHATRELRSTLFSRAQRHPVLEVTETVDARMRIDDITQQGTGFIPLHPEVMGKPFYELLNELIISLRNQLPARLQQAVLPLTKEEAYLTPIYYNAVGSLPYAHHGSHDSLIPFYDFCRQSGLKLDQIDASSKLASACGWFWPMKDICIMTARPKIVTTDSAGRMHNEKGPCLSYPDGWQMNAIHGVVAPPRLISFLRERTFAAIAAERNVEVRRMMLDIYGVEKFLREAGAVLIQKDECGALYLRASPNMPNPALFVCVINSTPEPDGHYRRYFIRVPPEMRTAREAVAWTFGLSAQEYKPLRET